MPIKTGLDRIRDGEEEIRVNRIGLLCNYASVDSHLRQSWDVINSLYPNRLKAIFSPQHGLFPIKQDNMKESNDTILSRLNVPVFSLYSKTRSPLKEQLDLIDALIVDLQDVGCRVYTFIWTLLLCMIECTRHRKELIILDRPNPINGVSIEGGIWERDYHSFVGMAPIPMRHGMTIGELSLLFKEYYDLRDLKLHIVRMDGWRREMYFDETGLPWVMPSPNMPTLITSIVYPGQVLLEGTNISEGRGTTKPFEIFGAPFINCDLILENISKLNLKGLILQEIQFEPTFNKYQGDLCFGFTIHVIDRTSFDSFLNSFLIIHTIKKTHKGFKPLSPPYEYEFNKKPLEIIIANRSLYDALMDNNTSYDYIFEYLSLSRASFNEIRRNYLLY